MINRESGQSTTDREAESTLSTRGMVVTLVISMAITTTMTTTTDAKEIPETSERTITSFTNMITRGRPEEHLIKSTREPR